MRMSAGLPPSLPRSLPRSLPLFLASSLPPSLPPFLPPYHISAGTLLIPSHSCSPSTARQNLHQDGAIVAPPLRWIKAWAAVQAGWS